METHMHITCVLVSQKYRFNKGQYYVYCTDDKMQCLVNIQHLWSYFFAYKPFQLMAQYIFTCTYVCQKQHCVYQGFIKGHFCRHAQRYSYEYERIKCLPSKCKSQFTTFGLLLKLLYQYKYYIREIYSKILMQLQKKETMQNIIPVLPSSIICCKKLLLFSWRMSSL